MPAKTTLLVCHLWGQLDGDLLWSQAAHCVCWFWSLLGVDSSAGQGQVLPVTSPGLPGRNYKAICSWLLPLLDLEAHGRGHRANHGWLSLGPDLGLLNKNPRVP